MFFFKGLQLQKTYMPKWQSFNNAAPSNTFGPFQKAPLGPLLYKQKLSKETFKIPSVPKSTHAYVSDMKVSPIVHRQSAGRKFQIPRVLTPYPKVSYS